MHMIESIKEKPEDEKDRITEARLEEEADELMFERSESLLKRS